MQRLSARIVGWGLAGSTLGGCGLGAGATDQAVGPASPTRSVATAPAIPGPAGTPDPAALTEFRCEPDATGEWSARGTVSNRGARADYLVTVVLAGPGDQAADGKRQLIPDLRRGGTYELRLNRLPVPAGEASCQVQVLRR